MALATALFVSKRLAAAAAALLCLATARLAVKALDGHDLPASSTEVRVAIAR